MFQINTRQNKDHSWQIDVIKNSVLTWNASFGGKNLWLYKSDWNTNSTARARIEDESEDGMSQEELLEVAVGLVTNWVNNQNDPSIKRDPAWELTRALTGHMAGFDGE